MTPTHYALDGALAPRRDALGRLLSEEARIAILGAERDLHAASGALAWEGLRQVARALGVPAEPAGDVADRISAAVNRQRAALAALCAADGTENMDATDAMWTEAFAVLAATAPNPRRVQGRPAGQRLADDPTPEARELLGLPPRRPAGLEEARQLGIESRRRGAPRPEMFVGVAADAMRAGWDEQDARMALAEDTNNQLIEAPNA